MRKPFDEVHLVAYFQEIHALWHGPVKAIRCDLTTYSRQTTVPGSPPVFCQHVARRSLKAGPHTLKNDSNFRAPLLDRKSCRNETTPRKNPTDWRKLSQTPSASPAAHASRLTSCRGTRIPIMPFQSDSPRHPCLAACMRV